MPGGQQGFQRPLPFVGRQSGALQQRGRRQSAGAGQGGQQQFVRRATGQRLEALDHVGAKAAVAAAGSRIEDAPAAQRCPRRGATQDEAVAAEGGHRFDEGQLQPAGGPGRNLFLADNAGAGGHFGRAEKELHLGVVGQGGIGVGQVAVVSVEA